MGASLATWCAGERFWVGDGRSEATRARAADAGLIDAGPLAELVERVDVVVSVCPPGAALEQAELVAATGYEGVYVDVNAISPSSARAIGERFSRFVDGGVIGPPVRGPGTTRLYLAGSGAAGVAALWEDTPLAVNVLEGPPGSASAVKTCFAAWTKGTDALLLGVRALARAEGVEEALLGEWAISIPDLPERSELTPFGNAPKAWRFVGEMEEIAEAFGDQGLPGGFAIAAAEIYRRLDSFKDSPGPSLDPVLERLLGSGDR